MNFCWWALPCSGYCLPCCSTACVFNYILLLYIFQYPVSEIFLCDFFSFYFNWRVITLQYCGGFCHTVTWISHGCTCVPHRDPPSHLPPHPIPQGHPSAPALSTLPHASNLDWRSISHMIIHVSALFSQIIPPLPSPTESKSLFFTSVSLLLSRI